MLNQRSHVVPPGDIIDRAYALAREGVMPDEIRTRLIGEGYDDVARNFANPMLEGDLRQIARRFLTGA